MDAFVSACLVCWKGVGFGEMRDFCHFFSLSFAILLVGACVFARLFGLWMKIL